MFLKRGDRLALVDFNDKKINYTELVNNVKYYSENVVTAEKDDFGLILMENRPEWIYTYFALWDRKAIPIALDSTSNSKEILYVLEDSGPKFIICSDETEKNVKEAVSLYDKGQVTIINVDSHLIDENKMEIIKKGDFELENPEGDSIATMLYTSGTTGSPKGVMLTFNNLSSELEGLEKKDLLEPTDQILALLPFHHVLPLTATVLIILQHQASMVFVKKIASKEILEALCYDKYPEGCANLAALYESDKYGMKDDKKATELYTMACKHNPKGPACDKIGGMSKRLEFF